MVRIENWFVIQRGNAYQAPELISSHLVGEIYNYPNKEDGKLITTSKIIGAKPEDNIIICESREYLLGEIDPEYEKQFPNAKEKLFKVLTNG